MIIADTGALLALLDRSERQHAAVRAVFDATHDEWVLPWAILPEVDYLVSTHLGPDAQAILLDDIVAGAFSVEWGDDDDLTAAREIERRYHDLGLGLVDASVIAVAERLRARAIVTLDLRHFGAVSIAGAPRLLPRDA